MPVPVQSILSTARRATRAPRALRQEQTEQADAQHAQRHRNKEARAQSVHSQHRSDPSPDGKNAYFQRRSRTGWAQHLSRAQMAQRTSIPQSSKTLLACLGPKCAVAHFHQSAFSRGSVAPAWHTGTLPDKQSVDGQVAMSVAPRQQTLAPFRPASHPVAWSPSLALGRLTIAPRLTGRAR